MKSYDHKRIEKKWQTQWEKSRVYATNEDADRPKQYVLDMFPYPSGEGLHVGHPKGYIATDVYSRRARMSGASVLHPMGWDAFGLPAENFAIKNKVHPRVAVEKNVARFKEQLKMIGLDYDWGREINTTDPEFYKWTQWIFLKLYEKGLAYQSNEPINWCPTCQTGLSNEDLEGNACERCGTIVERRPMRQWVLRITQYADRLLKDLDLLPEWQEHIKESQRNWIGRSEGAEIDFPLDIERMKRVVLLHGKGGSPSGVFLTWAREILEKRGYEVEIPALPNSTEPDDIEQAEYIAKHCTINESTIIVGHSAGGLAAMRLLESHKAGRLVLVATPRNAVFKDGKERPSVARSLGRGYDYAKIRGNVAEGIIALYDTHDDVVSADDGQAYASDLGAYLLKTEASEQHFNGRKEPDVLMAATPTIRVFTTRADTLFGATYLVLSPEHQWMQLALKHKTVLKNNDEVAKYVAQAAKKTELERMTDQKEKTGVKIDGVMAVNPVNGEKIPLYVADYVLAGYGTGAIMAVPAHDERDMDFAKAFTIPVREVVIPSFTDAENPPQKGKEDTFRETILAIVFDPTNNAYLTLKWKGQPWTTFITGGVEEGEDPIEAAKREISEETGYTDLVLEQSLGTIESHFYGAHKGVNRHVKGHCYLFHLKSDTRQKVSDEELAKHDVQWTPATEISRVNLRHAEVSILFDRIASRSALYDGEGVLINSGDFDGMGSSEAREMITERFGQKKVSYKIRDWVFSRQRYWGEPIPMIHCAQCGVVPVPESDLPVRLPEVTHYEPTGTGESPLASIEEWVNVPCPTCGGDAKRETNTMPQWAGSSWYYLRYMDPHNDRVLVDPLKEKYWAPVDMYVGGAEHATRHLIYARFWHKFLFDIGAVSTEEPFTRLISVGLIQAEDGRKMSKRFGNVINPDDIIETYGADTLRVYEMFMGPFTDAIAWKTSSLIGARRFIERVWKLQEKVQTLPHKETTRTLHKTIKKVGEDIALFKFNTAISSMMIFVNEAEKTGLTREQLMAFVQVLAPFAPHIADEMWSVMGGEGSVHVSAWPEFDTAMLSDDTATIAIQINGKVRGEVSVPFGAAKELVEDAAKVAMAARLEGETIARTIVVPNKLVNFVLSSS